MAEQVTPSPRGAADPSERASVDDVEGLFLELDALSCPRVWEAPKDGGPCFYCGVPMPGHSAFCTWQLMRQQLKHAKEAYRARASEPAREEARALLDVGTAMVAYLDSITRRGWLLDHRCPDGTTVVTDEPYEVVQAYRRLVDARALSRRDPAREEGR